MTIIVVSNIRHFCLGVSSDVISTRKLNLPARKNVLLFRKIRNMRWIFCAEREVAVLSTLKAILKLKAGAQSRVAQSGTLRVSDSVDALDVPA